MRPSFNRRFLSILFWGIIAGGFAAVALWKIATEMRVPALLGALHAISPAAVALSFAITIASYGALVTNELLALRYAGAAPPLRTAIIASFCGCAFGNVIGFGSLSSGTIRYRVYASAGLSAGTIARVTIFIAAAFAVGVVATSAMGIALRAPEVARFLGLSPPLLRGVVLVVLGFLGVVLTFCASKKRSLRLGRFSIEQPGAGLVAAQLVVTMLDISAAAAALWVLLPNMGVDFIGFVAIYAAAVGLGVLSNVPGGLGVFEAVILYALGPAGSLSSVAAPLILYRAIYFLLPFIVAAFVLAGLELRRALGRSARLCPGEQG